MDPNENSNLFASTVAGLQRGKVQAELSAKLDEVLTAAKLHGRAGSITLQLKLQPIPNTDGSQVFIYHDIKADVPKAPRKRDMRFVTDENQLLMNPPGQDDMFDRAGVVIDGGKVAPAPTPAPIAATATGN